MILIVEWSAACGGPPWLGPDLPAIQYPSTTPERADNIPQLVSHLVTSAKERETGQSSAGASKAALRTSARLPMLKAMTATASAHVFLVSTSLALASSRPDLARFIARSAQWVAGRRLAFAMVVRKELRLFIRTAAVTRSWSARMKRQRKGYVFTFAFVGWRHRWSFTLRCRGNQNGDGMQVERNSVAGDELVISVTSQGLRFGRLTLVFRASSSSIPLQSPAH